MRRYVFWSCSYRDCNIGFTWVNSTGIYSVAYKSVLLSFRVGG